MFGLHDGVVIQGTVTAVKGYTCTIQQGKGGAKLNRVLLAVMEKTDCPF